MAETDELVLSTLAFEAMADEYGWARLPSLWALDTNPDVASGEHRPEVAFGYRQLGEGDAYQMDDAEAAGATGLWLSWEGWDWPPDATSEERTRPPSAHPDRREIRMVMLAVRDGRLVSVAHPQDAAPQASVDEGAGPLLDALRAALHRS